MGGLGSVPTLQQHLRTKHHIWQQRSYMAAWYCCVGLTLNELSDSLSQWLFFCVRRGVSPLSERSRLCRGKGNHSYSPRSFRSRLHNTGVSQIQKLSNLQGVRGYRCMAQS